MFVVSILDDVSKMSLEYDPKFSTEADDVVRAVFFGLGSDGTVERRPELGQNRRRKHPLHAQGYFVYDSRKAG